MLESINCVQGAVLSKESINNVLARNNQNGYQRQFKRWKFFRASEPDELWQIDFKGPFTVGGKKYWFLVCIDDYRRFIVCAEQFDHELTTAETVAVLEKQNRLMSFIARGCCSVKKIDQTTNVRFLDILFSELVLR